MNANLKVGTYVIGRGLSACSYQITGMRGRITRVDENDPTFPYKVAFDNLYFTVWTGPNALKPDPVPAPVQAPSKGSIVCLLDEHGFPLPSKNPVVHANELLAIAEAERLATVWGGTFGVFTLVGTAAEREITHKAVNFTLA